MRKLISILIAVMMVLTLLPVGRVMAEDGKDEAALLKAAKDELQAQITKAEAIDLAKYEDGEVKAAFTQAIQAAEAVYGKADATLQDVKDETTKLENAITAFKEKAKEVTENPESSEDEVAKQKLADAKEALKAEIDKAKGIDLKKYEDGDVKTAFAQAIQAAEAVYGNAKATLDDVKAETTKLENAITAFKEKAKEVTENPESSEDEVAKQKLADAKEALKAEIDKAKGIDLKKYEDGDVKTAFAQAIQAAEAVYGNAKATLDDVKAETTKLENAITAFKEKAKKTTPVVPSDSYSTRVPRAIRTTIAKANAIIAHPYYKFASYKSTLDNAIATLKSIANDFENGYYNKYWNGKFWNGYYGDGWYDYYENGCYYRNGVPYSYYKFINTFGDYPRYDLSDGYYGRRYLNGKYRRGYYGDGWYDYSIGKYYYRNGLSYTYDEFKARFGYYPRYDLSDGYYGRRYWNEYDEDWDPHYGYQGRYGYYNSTIRNAVERTVDAINAVANELGEDAMKASYPSLSDYDGYYDYYPWYYDPYYYDGYYYDQSSSKVRELKKLIGDAEELASSRNDAQWAPFKSALTDAANYGRKAVKGRASVSGAIEELEKAIKKAKTDGMKLYIRRGFMTGVNGTEFNPNGTLTRAEMAQIIENLLEQSGETVAFAPKKFNDVESGRWFKKAVNLISSHNIMKGNPDGNFYPQKPVSIEELIVIAARLGGHTPQTGNVFGISKHYWSVPYIQTAYVKGWIGMDKFDPSAAITRGQAVQILNRSLNYGVDKEFINKYGVQMNQFSDVSMSNPYYYDIIAATNTISYSQVPNSRTRIWRAFQTSGGWSTSKYSNGTYVKPYTGW
ncbi:S-layer homology domain-containing protein [Ezakiella coagulans]|uniref:S-layer homology domain-containing protein n=1 Tax=Ezakiella coagulans TaxID=46507 RepID=UPI00288AC038|nr:S-layer homology domain-containing protein [Ezakiella coagulans]